MLDRGPFQLLTLYSTITQQLGMQSLPLITRLGAMFCLPTISFAQTSRVSLHTQYDSIKYLLTYC